MNSFILTYDALAANPTFGQILNHVQVNRNISQYYQPYVGSYLLKSEQSLGVLNESIKGLFDQSPFMLTQYKSDMTMGALPIEIWNWLNLGSVPQVPANPGLLNALLKP